MTRPSASARGSPGNARRSMFAMSAGVGEPLGLVFLLAARFGRTGSDDDLEAAIRESNPAIGRPSGPTNRALARPFGWSRTVTSSPACLPESSTVAPRCVIGVKKDHRHGLPGSSPCSSNRPSRA